MCWDRRVRCSASNLRLFTRSVGNDCWSEYEQVGTGHCHENSGRSCAGHLRQLVPQGAGSSESCSSKPSRSARRAARFDVNAASSRAELAAAHFVTRVCPADGHLLRTHFVPTLSLDFCPGAKEVKTVEGAFFFEPAEEVKTVEAMLLPPPRPPVYGPAVLTSAMHLGSEQPSRSCKKS